jgi:hypothetical protein
VVHAMSDRTKFWLFMAGAVVIMFLAFELWF